MNIFDMKEGKHGILWIGLQFLIVLDIFLISLMLLLNLPSGVVSFIQTFDLIICIFLLTEWTVSFLKADSKNDFLTKKGNWLDLIASIPFDAILPVVMPHVSLLRYFRLLKILRIIVLFNSLITSLENFIRKTNIDKVLLGVFVTIVIFTLVLWSWGTLSFADSLYFVIETITSVGYGDITPQTLNEKAITIVLIFVGVFVFSTITAVFSSFFTDRLIDDEKIEEDLRDVKHDLALMQTQNDELKRDLDELKAQNEDLMSEISELKELVKK
ncbi:ion transporter [uncultured Methanobrevibacter sp.]|uniref:ion transporter n=1 Tax=uncultured Methanobrevibacter sp. TaxID=253161 RepID=UPI0025DB9BC5|nr:ion transporter [uncultured Methanobrevibacter sp.]